MLTTLRQKYQNNELNNICGIPINRKTSVVIDTGWVQNNPPTGI